MRKRKDLTGQRFGKLTVLRELETRQNGNVMWECRCDCGKFTNVRSGNLTGGRTCSCGCACGGKRELRGLRFGNLVVIESTPERMGGHVLWKCRCDCGKELLVSSNNLISGNTLSCGCQRSCTKTAPAAKPTGVPSNESNKVVGRDEQDLEGLFSSGCDM